METTATILHADTGCLLCLGRAAARPFRCAAAIDRGAGELCLPLLTKPRPSGSAAACRDGRRASSVRNSLLSTAISRTTTAGRCRHQGSQRFSRPSSSGFPSTRLCRRRGLHPSLPVACRNCAGNPAPRAGGARPSRSRSASRAPSIWRNLLASGQPTGWWLSIPTPNLNSFTTARRADVGSRGPRSPKARLAEIVCFLLGSWTKTPWMVP